MYVNNNMKTKTSKQHKNPFHLNVEYFFRLKICLLLATGLLTLTVMRGDRDVLSAVPQAYAEGAGAIGSHMSEERLHPHTSVHVLRVPTISSGR